MQKHEPTQEQQAALALFATGKSLAIEAGAGTGKTSTLVLLAGSTRRRGQYVAFNKSIVEESKGKFPESVACSTAHSLAWRNVIARNPQLASRLKNSARMRSTEIADRLRIDPINVQIDGTSKQLARTFLAGVVMNGVLRFCQSADSEPEAKHVPYIDGIDVPPVVDGRRNRGNNNVVAKALVPYMKRAWEDITDDNGSLPFKHDHYLKMWHLSGPRINADYILFDEAQDANPVLVDIVRQQTHAQLVWVGDSQQQIYSFTGAINALASVGADQRTFLTRSFRFGPDIADVANTLLTELRAELRLTGTDSIESRVEDVEKPDVILSRTNARAVRSFLTALDNGMRPHLIGGGREVVDFAKGAQRLQRDGWTDHHELACFSSWGEVQLYVEQDEQGGDLRLLVKLIDEFGADRIIAALERMPREEQADLVISTAHKSKGREWGSVRLADDFPADPSGEELRLLYVAVTRAKRRLDVSGVKLLNGGWEPAGTGLTVLAETEQLDPEAQAPILRRHELPVAFAGVEVVGDTVVQGNHRAAAAERIGADVAVQDALAPAKAVAEAIAPHTVAEHLAGVPGVFSVLGNGGRTGRATKLGSYDDSRAAIEAASMLYSGGAFSAVTVIDDTTGELVVQYDA